MVNSILGPDYDLTRRLNQIEANVRQLATQPVLSHASTGSEPGTPGLSTDVNGLHLFNSAGVENVTLSTSDGSANFNGNVNINGNLSVPNGSISNSALQNPLSPLSQHGGTNNFGLNTGANSAILTMTINVPVGYTRAQVTALGVLHAYNSTAATDDLYAVASINGATIGASSQSSVSAGQDHTIPANAVATLTGLGASFQVALLGSTANAGWAASSVNFVNLDVSVTFLR